MDLKDKSANIPNVLDVYLSGLDSRNGELNKSWSKLTNYWAPFRDISNTNTRTRKNGDPPPPPDLVLNWTLQDIQVCKTHIQTAEYLKNDDVNRQKLLFGQMEIYRNERIKIANYLDDGFINVHYKVFFPPGASNDISSIKYLPTPKADPDKKCLPVSGINYKIASMQDGLRNANNNFKLSLKDIDSAYIIYKDPNGHAYRLFKLILHSGN